MALPLLPLGAAALAAIGFYKLSQSKGTKTIASRPSTISARPAATMPASLAEQMGNLILAMGFEDGRTLTRTPTVASVQQATSFASMLADLGYAEQAAVLRGYAEEAAKSASVPPANSVLPGLTPDEMDRLNRMITLERDPLKLRQAAAFIRSKSRDAAALQLATTLDRTATEIEKNKLAAKTALAVDEVMKGNEPPVVSAKSVAVPAAILPPVNDGPIPGAGLITRTPYWLMVAEMKTRPTLQRGSKGEAVKMWQYVLGFEDAQRDGVFGAGTQSATKIWQKAHGLTADGVVGRGTWAAASVPPTAAASPVAEIVTQAQTAVNATANAYGVSPQLAAIKALINPPTIRRGSQGPVVVAWQTYLGVPADGNYGSGTEAATKKWQASKGLTADGTVGPKSWAIALDKDPAAATAAALPSDVVIPKTQLELKADAVTRHLLALQAKHGMPGARGREDMTLIKGFQKLAGVKEDGKMGPGTTALLAKLGQMVIPLVMYWPANSGPQAVANYRTALEKIASDKETMGDTTTATAIRIAAANERGQAGIKGQVL